MNDELKQLIEDAAKLLGLQVKGWIGEKIQTYDPVTEWVWSGEFNPLDPDRGDLMKVAMAAGLVIEYDYTRVWKLRKNASSLFFDFTKGDYQSLALAVLRAASAVWKARNGNAE